MKLKFTIALFLLFLGSFAFAQTTLKGVVVEAGGGLKLENVFVRDLTNKQATLTDKSGKFYISTETGHILVFSLPGYTADTLYVINFAQQHVELKIQPIALREINIIATRTSSFDPHKEYPDVYEKAKVLPLSPSTWFSRDAQNARKLKKYFQSEAEERQIDKVFNRAYVGSLVPLKGQDLEDFMSLYRPPYKFIVSNNAESLAVYISDSYKKYKDLPADKRHLQSL